MDKRSLELLKVLRQKAVDAVVKHGLTQKHACEVFGFSQTTMTKYIRAYKEGGSEGFTYKKRGVSSGDRNLLNGEQEKPLVESIIKYTPDELGLESTLWTSKVINQYIKKLYNVSFSERGIRNFMTRLGFSAQKPIRVAYQRNPEKVRVWLEETYPAIKARACREGARIYWGDEMGVHSRDNRGRTYGLVGQTPQIKKSGSRFKCNVLAAISPQGFMNWMVFEENCTAEKFIEFLGRLIRQIKQKVFLIVDNLKVHHAKKVQDYVKKHQDKLQLFFLPPYCPEMNPQELVNQDVKANANNFRALMKIEDLTINVRYYLSKIQFDPYKIMNFFKKKEVQYAS